MRRLGAVSLQMNSTWAQLPPTWICPCCQRAKPDIIFLSPNGAAMYEAIEHHDHFGGYINHAFRRISRLVGAARIQGRAKSVSV